MTAGRRRCARLVVSLTAVAGLLAAGWARAEELPVVAPDRPSATNSALTVPRGFAHGYVTLEPDTEVLYKTDAYYDRATDAGIAWDDPALGVDWQIDAAGVILSDKDRNAPRLTDIPPPFPQGSW